MKIVIGGILLVVGCIALVIGLVGAGLFGVVIGSEPGIDKAMHNLVGCVMALLAIAIGWSLFKGRSGTETESTEWPTKRRRISALTRRILNADVGSRMMEYEDMMRERAQEAMQKEWSRQEWSPSPALATKTREGTSVTKFVGQKYNPKKTKLIEDGWDHDHCLFCSQSICNCGGENCEPVGFTDGNQWICESCHKRIIMDGKDPTST